ncbi:MAG TPA: MFS transporter [Pseudolabrys sp.]|nr:MFS transporter [Pseudolabrys sp.]
MRPVPRSDSGFAVRLAALYATLFVVLGIQLPFFPIWLKAKGLDPQMIGLVLAAPLAARIVAVPLATRAADRRDALRAVIVVMAAASVAGYLLVALAQGPLAVLVAYAVASFAFTPVMPLADTYALKGLAARGRAYGPVRLWGSAAFILGSFAAGFVTDAIPAQHLIWLILAASAVAALAATALAPVHVKAVADDRSHRRTLLRDPAFLAVLAAASLIQASHAVYYGFSALQWRGEGLDGAAIAALWALGVIAEIVLFALQGRLPPWFAPHVLLMIGALGATLRWSAMALNPPVLVLPLLQLLHAASFGATHLGMLGYVAAKAPPGQAATAQGYLAIALGTIMAGATALSGVLYGAFGSLAYAAMASAAIAGGAAAGIAVRASRNVAAV